MANTFWRYSNANIKRRHFRLYFISSQSLTHLCQPSIQKLVNSVANDAIANLAEETTRTDAYTEDTPAVKVAVDDLSTELSPDLMDRDLLREALYKSSTRAEARERKYAQTVGPI